MTHDRFEPARPRWLRRALAAAVLAAAAVVGPVVSGTVPSATAASSTPSLKGKTTTGGAWSLTDQRGRWVVVAFQASWCVPCRKEVVELRELQLAMPELRVVTVGYASDAKETSRLVSDLRIGWPALPDADGRIGQAWRVAALPTTVIVDPKGAVAARVVGGVTAAKVRSTIDAATR